MLVGYPRDEFGSNNPVFFLFLARKVRSLESDELQELMKKFPTHINDADASESQESNVDEDDAKKMGDTYEFKDQSSEEPKVDDDSEAISPPFVDINDRKFSSDSEED